MKRAVSACGASDFVSACRTVRNVRFLWGGRVSSPVCGCGGSGGFVLFQGPIVGFEGMVGTIYSLTPGRKFSRLRWDSRRVKYVLLQVRQRIDTAFIFSVENRETRAELERKSRLGRRKSGGGGVIGIH